MYPYILIINRMGDGEESFRWGRNRKKHNKWCLCGSDEWLTEIWFYKSISIFDIPQIYYFHFETALYAQNESISGSDSPQWINKNFIVLTLEFPSTQLLTKLLNVKVRMPLSPLAFTQTNGGSIVAHVNEPVMNTWWYSICVNCR